MAEPSGAPAIFDLDSFIEGRRLSGYNILIIAHSSLIMLFDGLDFAVVAFTAPYFGPDLGLSMTQVGGAFSAGTAGLVVGGIVFGRLADRFGRRPMILVAATGFSIFTFLTSYTQTYEQFLLLRVLDGFAIGGVMPLCWALNAECVSTSRKASAITWTQVGYAVGTALAGPLTNFIAPAYGWREVFLVASAGSAIAVVIALFLLPESIRFLAIRGSQQRLRAMILRLDPAAAIGPDTRVIYNQEQGVGAGKSTAAFGELFRGRLALLTPLLCLTYAVSSIAIVMISTWNPTILEGGGFTRITAANTAVIANLAGAMLGLLVMRYTDRMGPITVALFPAIAAPLMALVGLAPLAAAPFLVLTVVGQSLIGGGHFAVTSVTSAYYPTRLRASGGAFTSSVGKGAAAIGVLAGGAILEAGVTPLTLLALIAVLPAILVGCGFAIAFAVRDSRKRGGG